jgi:solute carrier family 29 (equilibrative nucleoside transporter) protein 4
LATLPCQWTRTQLLNFACARTLLIPLFLMCAIPRRLPVLSNELYAIILSVFLGVTNGIVGSVPMVQAPTKVPEEHRELAGNPLGLPSFV